MGKRRRARELAIQVLFHLEFITEDPAEEFDRVCENFGSPTSVRPFSKHLVLGVWENREMIDLLIRQSSTNWRLERMSHVDRNILRLGVYEILHQKDIPPKVTIDEAVELGKKYGTEESGSFINGILDHIYSNMKLEGMQAEDGEL
ncbi:transcription antitermination factor NusB [Thermodesulfobacteriota bacterium]